MEMFKELTVRESGQTLPELLVVISLLIAVTLTGVGMIAAGSNLRASNLGTDIRNLHVESGTSATGAFTKTTGTVTETGVNIN
jgi:hypothetical protein